MSKKTNKKDLTFCIYHHEHYDSQVTCPPAMQQNWLQIWKTRRYHPRHHPSVFSDYSQLVQYPSPSHSAHCTNRSTHWHANFPKVKWCHQLVNQSIYFAIKGHRPLTNHTSSTNITTERKAKLYKINPLFIESLLKHVNNVSLHHIIR